MPKPDTAIRDVPGLSLKWRLGWFVVRRLYELNRRRRLYPWDRPKASDKTLLEASISRLESTGAIEYSGEFGAEIATFVPFVHWLKTQGLLEGRRVVTYQGMRQYYYFLDPQQIVERPGPRTWAPINQRDWPGNSTYSAVRRTWQAYPDYRKAYVDGGIAFKKPIIFIQNKFTVENDKRPINCIAISSLKKIFDRFSEDFDIVYSRPRAVAAPAGYVADHNEHCDYPDLSVVRRYPGVMDLEAYCAEARADYNLTKLQILAKTYVFIAVQGGGSHLLACFGGSIMLILDFTGMEFPHAYGRGPYKYLSDPAPILLVARTDRAFDRGLGVLGGVSVVDGGVRITPQAVRAMAGLRI